MTTTTPYNGRLCNQIIRNLAVSIIAEKHNLNVNYSSLHIINALGIQLFSGVNIYTQIKELTDDNYFKILESDEIFYNLNPNNNYFQTKEITRFLYTYLHKADNKQNIINANPFKNRYNENNDLFIHIRLTDVSHLNPGLEYYLNAISKIEFNNLYIASDDLNHPIINSICSIQLLLKNYTEMKLKQYNMEAHVKILYYPMVVFLR
jgi:hypothetical protein